MMGEKKLGRIPVSPEEHELYMLVLRFGWTPDYIRSMALDDKHWINVYITAQTAANNELARRRNNQPQR